MSSTPVRTRRPAAQRRAEIADAARTLALRDGLGAVTLRAVATQAGVTPALVAHYAGGMVDLVASTFRDIVAGELAEVVAACDGTDAVDRLARLLAATLEPGRDDVTLVWVQAWALGRASEPLAAQVRTQMDAWQQAIRAVIEQGATAGDFRAADASAVAWQVLGMIDGLNAQALVRWGEPADRLALMARAVEAMLGMIDGLNAQALVRWGEPADRLALMVRAVEAMLGMPPGVLARRR